MVGFVQDIGQLTGANEAFRRVLYTAHPSQIVLITLAVGGEIGAETHKQEQFFWVEAGEGQAVLDGVIAPIRQGSTVLVPAGSPHNIINTGTKPLRLITIYVPPTQPAFSHRPAEAAPQHAQLGW